MFAGVCNAQVRGKSFKWLRYIIVSLWVELYEGIKDQTWHIQAFFTKLVSYLYFCGQIMLFLSVDV